MFENLGPRYPGPLPPFGLHTGGALRPLMKNARTYPWPLPPFDLGTHAKTQPAACHDAHGRHHTRAGDSQLPGLAMTTLLAPRNSCPRLGPALTGRLRA